MAKKETTTYTDEEIIQQMDKMIDQTLKEIQQMDKGVDNVQQG